MKGVTDCDCIFFYVLQINDGVEQIVLFQIEQYVHKEGILAGNRE